ESARPAVLRGSGAFLPGALAPAGSAHRLSRAHARPLFRPLAKRLRAAPEPGVRYQRARRDHLSYREPWRGSAPIEPAGNGAAPGGRPYGGAHVRRPPVVRRHLDTRPLLDYLDGRLDVAARSRVEDHLGGPAGACGER